MRQGTRTTWAHLWHVEPREHGGEVGVAGCGEEGDGGLGGWASGLDVQREDEHLPDSFADYIMIT